ncbi:conserved hypothetical protein [Aeropyrum pernix K1]|uniref:ABC-2 type transporter transmembrane domain-containing protein n=2 Tax=Aeropyrum pernix TaxID=56636 RepID=Q9YAW8_AERPE|nr:conserved hypothetical protein [Aeropyrum pernix K1]
MSMLGGISRILTQFTVMVWAHSKRAWRMRYNLVNWAIIDALWLLIFVFAGLAFTPPGDYVEVVPVLFFSVVMWSLMSTPVWSIGNWIKFYVAIGLMDEVEASSASHTLFLATRAIPSLAISLLSSLGVGIMLYSSTGVNIFSVRSPPLLALSLLILALMSTLYALGLAFIGLKLKVPAPSLDVMNLAMFFIGGVAVDVETLIWPLRLVAVLTPYSHPAEIMRYAVAGDRPYLGFQGELLASLLFLALLTLFVVVTRYVAYRDYRTMGPRGVGLT